MNTALTDPFVFVHFSLFTFHSLSTVHCSLSTVFQITFNKNSPFFGV
jgi:hypothetical protein